jgi:hypothetical protein
MPNWLYTYFGTVVKPLITTKEKRQLSMPSSFADNGTFSPPSFWIYPPEPAILLSRRHFDPTLFYRPRIFLWLPHFLVEDLQCPACKTAVLEKNGALPPRRIIDSQDCFISSRGHITAAKVANHILQDGGMEFWTPSLGISVSPFPQFSLTEVAFHTMS